MSDLRSVLKPRGSFVATILHPAFFHQDPVETGDGARFRKVTGYLEAERWWIDSFGGHWHYHRPLEAYVRSFTEAGFAVTGMAEPPSLPHLLRTESEWTDYERWFASIPTMLVLEARPI